ncbi:MAG: thioesterase domain-containing protein [Gammaproteobacteria bacterium]|nr:thioesterase [Sideroxydans sp.]MBU4150431.1 thioesterase domain-containing protein [Gammaproteobacteria bacterium]
MSATDTLTRFLHEHIPLTGAMQLQASAYDGERLELNAPLAPNVNDKGTAFGGSLYNLAVLCGWSLLRLKLNEAGLNEKNIVIHEAHTRYLLPVTGELHAACTLTGDALTEFIQPLQKKGRARITLTVAIHQQGRTAVEFTGQYVALD